MGSEMCIRDRKKEEKKESKTVAGKQESGRPRNILLELLRKKAMMEKQGGEAGSGKIKT